MNMFPVVDQNRQDAHPQTVHVHMHQVCACMHQYFPNYRPHILAPYHIQPVPRPFNMQHYQYTQFNLSPFNMPILHPGNAMTQAASLTPTTQQASSNTLDFGPPPRDRRHFETTEPPVQDLPSADASKENFFDDYNLTMSNLSDALQEAHGASSSAENFTKFLEQGCIVAEKIAIRNQHRPCFKNIQNLCNRTRSEILKPSNTVSNIHSQGIPWATKDFIYAFVRLINCWHMLKGYLDSKDGTLGNIDRELTPEFKNCYLAWEKNTKELAAHMIRIFTNLDNNVSNPNATNHNKIKPVLPQETSSPKSEPTKIKETVKLNRSAVATTNGEITENLLPESPTSLRDDDSDNESRVYMKPGSYNVPKKSNDSPNSSPSIEFFDTAQNVSAHYKKIAKKKGDNGITSTNDKMWQDAQSAVPYLMNKINAPQQAEITDRNTEEVDALKYFVDLNTLDHQASNIQEWLNNNNFFEQQSCSENLHETSTATPSSSISMGFSEKPVTVLQRSQMVKMGALVDQDANFYGQAKGFCKNNGNNRIEVQSRTYRKKGETSDKSFGKSIMNKKSNASTWEYDKGGLTSAAWMVLDDIVKILEQEEFSKRIDYSDRALHEKTFDEFNHVTSLATVRKKVTNRKYSYINEFVADLKSIISWAEIFYEAHHEIIHYITLFDRKLDLLLNRDFFAFDFASLPDKTDELGALVLKSTRKSDGDGDH